LPFDVSDRLFALSVRAIYSDNCPDNIFTKDLPLSIAKKPLGEFIEKGYFPLLVHAQNNTVGVLYKLAVFIFACLQHFLSMLKLCGYSF